jgi:HEPN domain-containing protein/predicted nucleotidyltransferase
MTSVTEDIQERIKHSLKKLPFGIVSVVIYGSWVSKRQRESSDIDLLIVSNEIHPKKTKRGKEIATIKEILSLTFPLDVMLLTQNECISNFRNHNPLFLDIAWEGIILLDKENFIKSLIEQTRKYISDKKIKKVDDGWIFPVVDRVATYLSPISNKDFADAMLTDGKRDFEICNKLLESGYFDKATYHFQQCVEKAVKSILICFGIFKRTHFVGEVLSKEVEKKEIETLWKERLIQAAKISSEIEPEVTWSRYPGIDEDSLWLPYKEYTAQDAMEFREKCKMAINTAQDFFAWWFK